MASPITVFGPWGGSGDKKWNFNQIVNRNGIKLIVVCVDRRRIKAISFEDGKGTASGVFGGANIGDKGVSTMVPINWPHEYLTSVSGSYSSGVNNVKVISSLTFTTNQTTHGPFGTISDDTFSIPTRDNVVLGFFGTCGDYLDSLGVFTTLAPLPTTSSGPQGGNGGRYHFSYKTRNRIVQIVLYVYECITSFSCTDSEGETSGEFGDINPRDYAGKKIQIDFRPGEYLTSISGSYGVWDSLTPVVRSLKLTTNFDTYGEYGTVCPDTFTIFIGDNTVVGFLGAYGSYLDSLGVYISDTK